MLAYTGIETISNLAEEARDPVRSIPASIRLAHGRSAGAAIIEEAKHRNAEIVVMGAARHDQRRHSAIFGDTVDYVLKYAPCRVMVVSAPWMQ
jgi:nucleotide-binding universal stress UspA family protein